ncbi:MAG: ABC transporter substrate-binding protein, partial [Dehalococcoidia bacterium]
AESFDPLGGTSFTSQFIARFSYPMLFQFKPNIVERATGEVEGQLVTDFEQPEPTKLVLHLREDAKWDERTPTDSRPLVADDVVFSWSKFEASSISRNSLANSANPSAPIESMEAIDDHTVEITTAFPYGPLLPALSYTRWLQIMPMESDGGFDPRADMRGAGPWMLTRYEPSVRYEFRKNPNYWMADRPFLDGIDAPIVSEYAQRLAQFRSGNIYGGVVSQEDIIATKEDIPELEVFQGEFGTGNWKLYFGLREGSPFRDERVRRAVSMLIDRDLLIETFNNTAEFEDAGWPVETRWHGVGIAAGYDAFWLDPQTDALGEGAASFAFNPTEAQALMDAAGVSTPLEVPFSYIATAQYGTTFPRVGEAYKGMLESTGLFRLTQQNPDYQTEYLPNIYFANGDFDGIAWGATTTFPVPIQHLNDYYHSQGARQKVAFMNDPTSIDGQVQSDALIEQAIQSLDFEETVELIHEWQRVNSMFMPTVASPYPGATAAFGLNWPWVKNFASHRDYLEMPEQTTVINWWLDR